MCEVVSRRGHGRFYDQYPPMREPVVVRIIACNAFALLALFAAAVHAQPVAVEISGVNNGLHDDLMSAVSLAHQKDLEHLTLARIKALFGRARDEIKTALEVRGYYQPHIDGRLTQPKASHWLASFRIDPGPQTRIAALTLAITGTGKDDKELQDAAAAFPLKTGDPFKQADYEQGKGHIEDIARRRGYFDAAWTTHTVKINVDKSSAGIDLRFDTGPRYRFGEISLPDTVIAPAVLRRMLPFKEGDPYDANQLITLNQTLRDSDYFDDVLVTPQKDHIHDQQVPIKLTLKPRPRNSYQIGGGFGTDTGPRLTLSWNSHYFNRRGHRIETELHLSPVQSSATGSYIMPYFHTTDSKLAFSTSLSREDTNSYISNILKLGTQYLTTVGTWNQTLGLTYQYENYQVGGNRQNTPLLIPSVGYWKTVSDNPVYTHNGYKINFNLRGAAKGVVSAVSFVQADVTGKYIHGLGERGRFITRGEFGATRTSNFSRLPASLRFYAGGDNSVRGFGYQALGPKDSDGNVIGGRYLITGSVQYEYRFLDKWSLAVFSDFGNAFNSLNHYNLEYSVGTGVHWLSPVGQIRVDVGVGISRSDLPIGLHIVVGPDL